MTRGLGGRRELGAVGKAGEGTTSARPTAAQRRWAGTGLGGVQPSRPRSGPGRGGGGERPAAYEGISGPSQRLRGEAAGSPPPAGPAPSRPAAPWGDGAASSFAPQRARAPPRYPGNGCQARATASLPTLRPAPANAPQRLETGPSEGAPAHAQSGASGGEETGAEGRCWRGAAAPAGRDGTGRARLSRRRVDPCPLLPCFAVLAAGRGLTGGKAEQQAAPRGRRGLPRGALPAALLCQPRGPLGSSVSPPPPRPFLPRTGQELGFLSPAPDQRAAGGGATAAGSARCHGVRQHHR